MLVTDKGFSAIAIVAVEPRQSLNVDERYFKPIATVRLTIVHVQCPQTTLAQTTLPLPFD